MNNIIITSDTMNNNSITTTNIYYNNDSNTKNCNNSTNNAYTNDSSITNLYTYYNNSNHNDINSSGSINNTSNSNFVFEFQKNDLASCLEPRRVSEDLPTPVWSHLSSTGSRRLRFRRCSNLRLIKELSHKWGSVIDEVGELAPGFR